MSDGGCTRAQPARVRAPRRQGRRSESRLGDPPQVTRQILLHLELADDVPVAIDEEDARQLRPSLPAIQYAAGAVVHARVRDAVLGQPLARVGTVILRVDADERHAVAVTLVRALQPPRLLNARDAPRGPEIQYDRFATAHGREIDLALAVQTRKIEVRSGRTLARGKRARDAAPVPVHDAPDQQREQRRHQRNGERLRKEPQAAGHQSGTIKTAVPMRTWTKSHSASGMRIRMHPCETE